MSLDLAVARVIMKARLLEHGLHASGEWTISVGDVTVPANRSLLDDRIVFSALFSELPEGSAQTLSHAGIEMAVRPFTVPDFAPFIIDWALVLEQDPVAA